MNTQVSTVHIVDDDEAFRVALARLLRAAGHRVQTYSCAKPIFDSQRRFLLGRCSPRAASRAMEVSRAQKCSAISLPKVFSTLL